MPRPVPATYPAFFDNYISLVDVGSAGEAREKYATQVIEKFKSLPADKAGYSYAPGKWTLKEVLQHLIDAERIFAYRALCLARKDSTPLPGFDENTYAVNSKASNRTWDALLQEFEVVRNATDLLLVSFDDEQLAQTGITNNSPNTVNAIAFVTYGHILHHLNIIKQRYL